MISDIFSYELIFYTQNTYILLFYAKNFHTIHFLKTAFLPKMSEKMPKLVIITLTPGQPIHGAHLHRVPLLQVGAQHLRTFSGQNGKGGGSNAPPNSVRLWYPGSSRYCRMVLYVPCDTNNASLRYLVFVLERCCLFQVFTNGFLKGPDLTLRGKLVI
jgi:hypothetical protein